METQEVDPAELITRQAIIDRDKNSFGYELLYQNSPDKFIPLLASNHKTAQALLNRFASLPADKEIEKGRKPVFINMDCQFLLIDALPALLFPAIIIELNPEAADHVENLLAYKNRHPQLKLCLGSFRADIYPEELLKIADYISIDLQSFPADAINTFKPLGSSFSGLIKVKNIQTADDFKHALMLDADLFSGEFLIAPELSEAKMLSANAQATLRLLGELYNPDTNPEKIERAIIADTILTTQLLRLINSAAFGMARKIENIKEAIVFLGLSMLRQWVSLLVLSSQKNKPSELMRINLVRAAFCRDLAQLLETVDADKAFLMGLISMIDAYLDFPLKNLLDDLPLSDDINQALLSESGILGDILSSVRHYEQADWPNLGQQQLAEAVWGNLYLGALNWADDTIRLIHAN